MWCRGNNFHFASYTLNQIKISSWQVFNIVRRWNVIKSSLWSVLSLGSQNIQSFPVKSAESVWKQQMKEWKQLWLYVNTNNTSWCFLWELTLNSHLTWSPRDWSSTRPGLAPASFSVQFSAPKVYKYAAVRMLLLCYVTPRFWSVKNVRLDRNFEDLSSHKVNSSGDETVSWNSFTEEHPHRPSHSGHVLINWRKSVPVLLSSSLKSVFILRLSTTSAASNEEKLLILQTSPG